MQVNLIDSALPATGAWVLLYVKVPRKNHYSIGPKCVGENALVTFFREEIEASIALDMKTFPMDYISTFSEALAIEAKVMDKAALERLIEARKLWGIGVPEVRLSEEEEITLKQAAAQNRIVSVLKIPLADIAEEYSELVLRLTTRAFC